LTKRSAAAANTSRTSGLATRSVRSKANVKARKIAAAVAYRSVE
jgi:hypothetical protein